MIKPTDETEIKLTPDPSFGNLVTFDNYPRDWCLEYQFSSDRSFWWMQYLPTDDNFHLGIKTLVFVNQT